MNPAAVVIVATCRAGAEDARSAPSRTSRSRTRTPFRAAWTTWPPTSTTRPAPASVIVAINQFPADTPEELAAVHAFCESRGAVLDGERLRRGVRARRPGGEGRLRPLPRALRTSRSTRSNGPPRRRSSGSRRMMYGADGVVFQHAAESKLKKARRIGYGKLPVCMAKTQDSLSDNPKLRGRPRGFTLTVRDVEIAAGAGFLVALTGEIVRMPGLPERPAAERIDVDPNGNITGLT
ncbi:MAG: formate--tetrahydrofolate ligase [Isosphaeraceae bacterium]